MTQTSVMKQICLLLMNESHNIFPSVLSSTRRSSLLKCDTAQNMKCTQADGDWGAKLAYFVVLIM